MSLLVAVSYVNHEAGAVGFNLTTTTGSVSRLCQIVNALIFKDYLRLVKLTWRRVVMIS